MHATSRYNPIMFPLIVIGALVALWLWARPRPKPPMVIESAILMARWHCDECGNEFVLPFSNEPLPCPNCVALFNAVDEAMDIDG